MPCYIVGMPALRLELQENGRPLLLKGKMEQQAAILPYPIIRDESAGRATAWILTKQMLAFCAAFHCTFPHIGFIGGLQLNLHPSFVHTGVTGPCRAARFPQFFVPAWRLITRQYDDQPALPLHQRTRLLAVLETGSGY